MTGRRILAALVDGKAVEPTTRHPRLVRVFLETGGDYVVVEWKERGQRQYRKRSNTPAERAEAIAWAQGFSERLARPIEIPDVTLREMWVRYADAAFVTLRVRSRQIYQSRWGKWERFLGRDASAKLTTPEDMDRFRAELTRAGVAVNQIRNIHRVVKVVYRWAVSRKLLPSNPFADYRFELGKDDLVHEPAEFLTPEWEAILGAMGGQTWGSWRPHAVTLFAGGQGGRIRAILHLQWVDFDLAAGTVTWSKRFDKQGRERVQPLTDDAWAAVLTAWAWRQALGYEGPWVFFSEDARSGTRRDGREEPGVYRYQSWHKAFLRAQAMAGVERKPFRAAHGFRKMSSGNVLERTKDPKAALDWIGDKDPRRMREYLKEREERMREIAATMSVPTVHAGGAGLPQRRHTAAAAHLDRRRGHAQGVVLMEVSDLMQRATGRIRTDDRVHLPPPENTGSSSESATSLNADPGVNPADPPQNAPETTTPVPHRVADGGGVP